MKRLLTTLLSVLVCGLIHAAITSPQNITFLWTYSPSDVTPDLFFKLYSSPNPTGPWAVVKTIPGTNTQTTISVVPAKAFYYITASNFWGESDPSNVAGTPALPSSGGTLSITKGP